MLKNNVFRHSLLYHFLLKIWFFTSSWKLEAKKLELLRFKCSTTLTFIEIELYLSKRNFQIIPIFLIYIYTLYTYMPYITIYIPIYPIYLTLSTNYYQLSFNSELVWFLPPPLSFDINQKNFYYYDLSAQKLQIFQSRIIFIKA